ncbi:MAG: streptomycin biosynthesis protein StrG [Pseudobutyrivibrio sp.]|nr:streptomycin biosynthesis protein StrG [Pseudobutyrivibrio sp.]
MLEMSTLDEMDDEQIKKLLSEGYRFKHRTLEELIEEKGEPLVASPEFDWGDPVGREIW